ncbi:MAG: tyrosine-type recombinase/integrase [Chloroflexota bacterium]|nr:tyrosine-type recombinase/integrase [Chloroflexota bacterium]
MSNETKKLKVEQIEIQRRNAHIVPKSQAFDTNPALVYLASLSPGSRRTMQHALGTIAEILGFDDFLTCPWAQLRFQHTAAIRSELMGRYASSTANKMLSALRGTLKRAWKLGQMEAEDYRRAIDLNRVTGDVPDAAAGRALSHQELRALLHACQKDNSPKGVRDAAILSIAYSAGLRRNEFVTLDLEDFDATTNTLTVRGKRNKTRTVPLADGTRFALTEWLAIRGNGSGPLFVRIWKGGQLSNNRLTSQAIYHIQQQRAKEAGIAHFSPHDLRRTFAGDLLDAGVDISTVQKLMGHADANTTARYDRRGERAKREAVEKLQIPYQDDRLGSKDQEESN